MSQSTLHPNLLGTARLLELISGLKVNGMTRMIKSSQEKVQ